MEVWNFGAFGHGISRLPSGKLNRVFQIVAWKFHGQTRQNFRLPFNNKPFFITNCLLIIIKIEADLKTDGSE